MAIRVSLVCNEERKNDIINTYKDYQRDNKGEYIVFFAKRPDLVVTIYSSKKPGEFKTIFVGDNALEEAQIFDFIFRYIRCADTDWTIEITSSNFIRTDLIS